MPDVRSFNIEAFKAKFGDGAKSSLFYFQPQWPVGLNPDLTQEDAIYLVKTAQMPSTALEEVTLNWQGFDWKFPGKHTYTDFVVTFNVDLEVSEKLIPKIPKDKIIVVESGIKTNKEIIRFKDLGAHAVLIGETFMRASDVAKKVKEIMQGEDV